MPAGFRASGSINGANGSGAVAASLVRGACPTVAVPMATGDGLLARLPPQPVPLTPASLAGLCAAAEACGNGILEITRRGSIQVRGLRPETVANFGAALRAAGVATDDGVPVFLSPLAGIDPAETDDMRPVAGRLAEAISASSLAPRLAAKLSIVLDGGGRLHLDALAADIRVAEEAGPHGRLYRLSLAGNALEATLLGGLARENIVPALISVLRRIAGLGRHARARDLLDAEGAPGIRSALGRLLTELPPRAVRAPAEPVGVHPLGDGFVAVGIGLAFGHARTSALRALLAEAVNAGARAFAPAERRVLLAIGVPAERAGSLIAAAERLGFIARPDDPRRSLSACAGAPDCPSGRMPARGIAPEVARILAPVLDGSIDVHLSGCAKGCAHPGPATLTLVGGEAGCGVVLRGRAGDTPAGHVPAGDLSDGLARFVAEAKARRLPGETVADLFRRLGGNAVASILLGETVDG